MYVCTCSYESDAFDEWTAKVEGVVKINLEKPLLVRNDESMLLTLNFNPEVRILCNQFSC